MNEANEAAAELLINETGALTVGNETDAMDDTMETGGIPRATAAVGGGATCACKVSGVVIPTAAFDDTVPAACCGFNVDTVLA